MAVVISQRTWWGALALIAAGVFGRLAWLAGGTGYWPSVLSALAVLPLEAIALGTVTVLAIVASLAMILRPRRVIRLDDDGERFRR